MVILLKSNLSRLVGWCQVAARRGERDGRGLCVPCLQGALAELPRALRLRGRGAAGARRHRLGLWHGRRRRKGQGTAGGAAGRARSALRPKGFEDLSLKRREEKRLSALSELNCTWICTWQRDSTWLSFLKSSRDLLRALKGS